MNQNTKPQVYVVDDEPALLLSLSRLLRSAGVCPKTFSCAEDYLKSPPPDGPACLVLDISMPRMTGMELQQALASQQSHNLPIVFITGHGDIPMSVKAIKAGAVDFLPKPFNDDALLNAIRSALAKDLDRRKKAGLRMTITDRITTLTPREKEVFRLVVTGLLNKQIAAKMDITERTIKAHRARVMEKMQARSLADLIHLAQETGLHSPE